MMFRIGLVAMALSFVPWLAIAAAPLFGLSLGASAGLVGGLLVAAEVLFWTGLALAGKQTWQAVKARGWRHAPRELWRLFVRGRPAAAPDDHVDRPVAVRARTGGSGAGGSFAGR